MGTGLTAGRPEPEFALKVTVRVYGPGTAEEAAGALRDWRGTFDADSGEIEILDVQVVPGMSPDRARWHGWRLTLNCGHLELTDLDDRQVGQLTMCDMCPLTVHSPESPGRPARQVRVIVNREPAEATQEPATVDPAYWYAT